MQFKEFSKAVSDSFTEIQKNKLFRSSVSSDALWDIYISSFKQEDDPVFRDPESSEHNCNLDKNFIRRYGNIVSIDENYNIQTMWDLNLPESNIYYSSCKAMSNALKTAEITDVFFETYDELNSLPYEKINKNQPTYRLGIESNHKTYTKEEVEKFGVVKEGVAYQFNHFYGNLDTKFVDKTGESIGSILSKYKSAKDVFLRGMLEIPIDTLELVKDLIIQGSLLNGDAHIIKIESIIPLKKEFDKISDNNKDNWTWLKSYDFAYSKFRNELIGTLCVELAEGVELNQACKTWNKRVDPANYMKAKAPITKRQIKEAEKFVQENGYEESFNRRLATIDDINVDEILHSNVGSDEVKTASIFDSVKSSVSTRYKRSQFDGIEEVSIDKFMKDILPSCTQVEAFFENRMQSNLMALTTSVNKNSKPIFKWDNNFSWTFNGNLTGKSQIKDEVKNKGGNVSGVLRCSMSWADGNEDNSDLDLHCTEPNGNRIYFSSKVSMSTGGNLDIDIQAPNGRLAVENIAFPSISRMIDGQYHFFVRQFSERNSKGFNAEIEFNDEIFQYEYNTPLYHKQDVKVATVTLKNGEFSIEHHLPELNSSKEVWNIETNQFHKVNLVALTPNHWGKNNIGNKHYMFMLDNCKSDVELRGFHNENLNGDLLKHRKVMEVLANTTMIKPQNKQLCGLGFNSTVKDELILKLSGNFKRTIKVKF